jgi:signal transduction histidine kinase/ActR/RegA family two-component response regulator
MSAPVLPIDDGRLRAALDAAGEPMLVVDPEGVVLHANAAAARVFGRDQATLHGLQVGVPAGHGGVAELDIVRPNGETAIAELRVLPVAFDGQAATLLLVRDVTRAKRDQQALRLSAAMVEGVLDAIDAPAALIGADGLLLAVNSHWSGAGQASLGDRAAGPGAAWHEIAAAVLGLGPVDAPLAVGGVAAVLEGVHERYEQLYEPVDDDRPRRLVATALHAGGLRGAVCRLDPVMATPADDGAAMADAGFRAVFDRGRDAKILLDGTARVIHLNDAARALLGIAPGDSPRLRFDDFLPTASGDISAGAAWTTLLRDGTWRGEGQLGTGEAARSVDILATAHVNAGVHLVTIRDITDTRRIEGQLRQAQKMEAVGLLTGGLAHDFNNLLTVVLANADLVLEALPAHLEEQRAELRQVLDAAQRGSDMVRKLLAFGRREALERRPVALEALLAETTALLARVLPASIRIQADAEPELPAVLADPGAVQHMLFNLATNARDAMAQGGELRMHARMVPSLPLPGGGRGPMVALVVTDTGTGMDEAVRARVFEPFFTTKAPGEGSGLGMAMIYGFVEQHEGTIDVDSAPGRGTTVTIHLPIAEPTIATATPRSTPAVRSETGGGELVLIVEDEDMVRRAGRRILEKNGYRVLLAGDGEEALTILRDRAGDIALVVSDVVMPRMGGRELYESARGEGIVTPFLFTSGYTDRIAAEAAALDPSIPVLPKPWTWHELSGSVRSAIDESRRAGTIRF